MRRRRLLASSWRCCAGRAISGWHMVRPGEQIVVRRFGRLVEPAWGRGCTWGFPLGIDRFDRVRTDLVRRLTSGRRKSPRRAWIPSAGEFLTGDLNLVRIQAIVQYRVARPGDFGSLRGTRSRPCSTGSPRPACPSLARRGIDAVLRSDRQRVADEVAATSRAGHRRATRLGLQILGVSLIDARPPAEVAADFVAAQSAESQRDRRGTEARTLAETTVTAAGARLPRRWSRPRGGRPAQVSSWNRMPEAQRLPGSPCRGPALAIRSPFSGSISTR